MANLEFSQFINPTSIDIVNLFYMEFPLKLNPQSGFPA